MNTIARLARRTTAALALGFAALGAHAAPAITDHRAIANGVGLHYLQAGSGGELPVVLLHGYAETATCGAR